MGGNGSFASGINKPYNKYKESGYIEGIKILKGIQGHHKLPEESKNSRAYILLDHNNIFKRIRFYGKNNKALLDIDYHPEKNLTGDINKSIFHYHIFSKGKRKKAKLLTDKHFNKYKKYFKGVTKYD